jgi:hypothetical protein
VGDWGIVNNTQMMEFKESSLWNIVREKFMATIPTSITFASIGPSFTVFDRAMVIFVPVRCPVIRSDFRAYRF